MTLAEYRIIVRALLVDTDYDATLIDQAINWMVLELCTNNHLRIMEASDEIFGSQGDTEIEFPEDMLTLVKEGFYMTSPQVQDMGPYFVEYGTFQRSYANFASVAQARAHQWTDFNNKARFSAPLNADHTFAVDYLRVPVDMEEDDDECEIPARYSEIVSKGALARIMEINEDYAEASQERDNFSPQMTTFIKNESRGGFKTGPTVMRTNRGRGRGARAFRADLDI